MLPSCNYSFISPTTTFTYTCQNDQTTPTQTLEAQIPKQPHLSAATKIQSNYRAHKARTLYKKISSVQSEADTLQRRIQQQDTVDAIRSSERERLGINEALMRLLLRLDSVPGVDPTVREARRKVSRRIVGLQEIVDGICGGDEGNGDGFFGDWDEIVAEMEKKVCVERGGEEMERFCAEYLGFR